MRSMRFTISGHHRVRKPWTEGLISGNEPYATSDWHLKLSVPLMLGADKVVDRMLVHTLNGLV